MLREGSRVVVVGMGRTAQALVRLLLAKGFEPFVTESGQGTSLEPFRVDLEALGVPYECGAHSDSAFRHAAAVIPSPGVNPNIEPIRRARDAGAMVLGEMEFASWYCRSRVLAVTGTNGKTTTTELLRTLVDACGHSVQLAGNNAFPFSAAVMAEPAPEYIVLEVSSYQLQSVHRFRPWIGAVLNVTPDHLERHRSVDEYARVKGMLFGRQGRGDVAVVNADDPLVSALPSPPDAARWAFSLERRCAPGVWAADAGICCGDECVARYEDNPLPGRHNLANVLAALAMMRAGNFEWGGVLAGLRGFRGVEHRIEFTAAIDGVDYYNDSKATNIDSLRVALKGLPRPIVLIAGGRGKGADYRVLRDLVQARVAHMVTLGEDAAKLEAAFGDLMPWERAADMQDAVERARRAAQPGQAVLLSPACASFDMYADFEERGRHFKACVARLAESSVHTPAGTP